MICGPFALFSSSVTLDWQSKPGGGNHTPGFGYPSGRSSSHRPIKTDLPTLFRDQCSNPGGAGRPAERRAARAPPFPVSARGEHWAEAFKRAGIVADIVPRPRAHDLGRLFGLRLVGAEQHDAAVEVVLGQLGLGERVGR